MGYVTKIVAFSKSENKLDKYVISRQLPEDQFSQVLGEAYGTVVISPPYSLEALVFFAESYPVHSAAIEQKMSDIVASGIRWVPIDLAKQPDDSQKVTLGEWWEGLFGEYTSLEVLQAVWLDYETVGWGLMEITRHPNGEVARIYHVPAHTVRAHRDGVLFAQIRNGRVVWFKKWGVEEEYDYRTGQPLKGEKEYRASELLVFRKPSRRSAWYGIPGYISAIGWISLGLSARDYNIQFFTNAREPRHVFVLTGLDENVDQMIDDLARNLAEQHKDPHKNLIIPLIGEGDVKVHRLALSQNDMHFSRLMDKIDEEILVAHRIPPDRIGVVHRGFLGGNVAALLNRIYKDSIVNKGQAVLLSRLNRFIQTEWLKAEVSKGLPLQWKADLDDLDLTDEEVDINNTVKLLKANVITINEARQRLGLLTREEFGDLTLGQYLAELGISQEKLKSIEEVESTRSRFEEELVRRLESIDDAIEMVLFGTEGEI